jgi:Cof subfamily protein (haloacid dehalogenase superfamily)
MDTAERKDIKLLAVDVDGTLLNSKHEMTERTKTAIRDAVKLGVNIMFATGKTYHAVQPFYQMLGITTPGVFVQGTCVYNPDGTIRHQQSLPIPVLRRLIPFVEGQGFAVIAYSGSRLLVKAKDSRLDFITDYHEPKPEVVGSLTNLLGTVTMNKLVIIGNNAKATKGMYWQVDKMMDGLVHATYAGITTQFEVLPLGVSKGKAVIATAKELGISADRVMTMGDADNDLEMLNFGSVTVAMGNAPDRVKNVAKYVTGSNDHDGAAEAIERFILPPKPAPAPEVAVKPASEEPKSEEKPNE